MSVTNLGKDGDAEDGLDGEGVGNLAEPEEADEENQTELHVAASLGPSRGRVRDKSNIDLHYGLASSLFFKGKS